MKFGVMLRKWGLCILVLLIGLFLLSYSVTKIRYMRKKNVYENFQNEEENRNPSPKLEKAMQLLPYLKTYLLDTHPLRNHMVSVDAETDTPEYKERRHKDHVWQNLNASGKNKLEGDWTWNGGVTYVPNTGFPTSASILKGPPARDLDASQTGQLTVILRAQSSETDQSTQPKGPPTIEEVIQNSILCAGKKEEEMWLVFPAHEKDLCDKINACLNETVQTPDHCQDTWNMAKQLQTEIAKLPNNGRKPERAPVAMLIPDATYPALVIRIPKTYGPIEVEVEGKSYKTKKSVNANLDTYYSFVYSDKYLKIYTDSSHLHTFTLDSRMNFNHDSILINPKKEWNTTLMEVAILNTYLHPDQLALFRFKNLILRAILQKHQDGNRIPGLAPPEGCVDCTGVCVGPDGDSFNPFKPHHKPKQGGKGYQCEIECDCSPGDDPFNPEDEKCPKVNRNNRHYIVGGIDYGRHKKRAREIYQYNYPNCPVPDVLTDGYEKRNAQWNQCPFVFQSDLNPCISEACADADWEADSPKDANLNRECRRRINAYCEEHPQDEFCACWRKENWNLEKCRKFRRKFVNPGDRGCDIRDFNIQEHPDMSDYIRKDRIPCYGCDLMEASGEASCPDAIPQSSEPGIGVNVDAKVSFNAGSFDNEDETCEV